MFGFQILTWKETLLINHVSINILQDNYRVVMFHRLYCQSLPHFYKFISSHKSKFTRFSVQTKLRVSVAKSRKWRRSADWYLEYILSYWLHTVHVFCAPKFSIKVIEGVCKAVYTKLTRLCDWLMQSFWTNATVKGRLVYEPRVLVNFRWLISQQLLIKVI